MAYRPGRDGPRTPWPFVDFGRPNPSDRHYPFSQPSIRTWPRMAIVSLKPGREKRSESRNQRRLFLPGSSEVEDKQGRQGFPVIDFSSSKGLQMLKSNWGFAVPDTLRGPRSESPDPEHFVELACHVDGFGNSWLLLPSGRVTRQSSSVRPVSVEVLSGPVSPRVVAPGFSATSFRRFPLADVAILEGESLLSLFEV